MKTREVTWQEDTTWLRIGATPQVLASLHHAGVEVVARPEKEHACLEQTPSAELGSERAIAVVTSPSNTLGLKRQLHSWKRPYLVASSTHLPRATRIFRERGRDVIPVAGHRVSQEIRGLALSWLPSLLALAASTEAIKELILRIFMSVPGKNCQQGTTRAGLVQPNIAYLEEMNATLISTWWCYLRMEY